MAIEAESATVPLSASERVSGLNYVAELRTRYWGSNSKELELFIAKMREKHVTLYEENSRALAAIFYLAKIPVAHHELQFNTLTDDEKKALILAMNHLRAVVSLFPKRLSMPN